MSSVHIIEGMHHYLGTAGCGLLPISNFYMPAAGSTLQRRRRSLVFMCELLGS